MGASQINWQYGPSGQVTLQNEQGAGTSEGPISRRYDSADRLLGTTTPAGQLSYDYDGAGRLIAHTAPDGTISRYFHDSAGRLIRTERALQAVPAGQPLAGERQSLITHYRYDDDDLLTAIAHVRRIGSSADTDTVLAGQALSRAPGGAITQLRTYRGGAEPAPALRYDSASGQFSGAAWQQHDYEYDANARLTRENITAATGALITDTRYRYDSVGNRIGRAVTDSAGTTQSTYEYDSADRLVRESTLAPGAASAAVTVYGWDAAGRLASRSEGSGRTVLYRWDGASRLIDLRTGASAAQASAAAPLIRYGYDADGQRVRKHVADSASGATRTVHYLLDTSSAHAQVAARATTVQEMGGATRTARSVFHWGAGSGAAGTGLIRQEHWADGDAGSGTPTALLLPLQGHLGTSLGAVDATGQVVETISHDAFGQRTDAAAAVQSHRFAGEYWDEDAQLVYLRARWYDPKIGGFISADPFEGQQDNPRSLNRYSYASNDPTNSTDPSGRMTIGESSVATAVVATVAAMAPSTAFAGGMGDLSNSEKKFFAEMYAEQVLKLPTDNVMRNVRGYAMVNGARIDLEFDRVFIDPSRSYIKVAEVKWGQNSQYTTNQRIASLQITQGDIYLTGPQAASNRINPNKTLKEQFGYQHVIFTVNGTRVLRSDITKVRLRNGARLFSYWVINVTGMQ